jgi:hypothetical protein
LQATIDRAQAEVAGAAARARAPHPDPPLSDAQRAALAVVRETDRKNRETATRLGAGSTPGINANDVPQPAVISAISESSLTVVQKSRTTLKAVAAEAERGCALYNKTATPVSNRCFDDYCSYLYVCR